MCLEKESQHLNENDFLGGEICNIFALFVFIDKELGKMNRDLKIHSVNGETKKKKAILVQLKSMQ